MMQQHLPHPDRIDRPERPARPPRHDRGEDAAIRSFAIEAARLCHDRHAEQVQLFDVRGLSTLTDYILIASGTSDRQLEAIARELDDLGKAAGFPCIARDGDGQVRWVVHDYLDVVVHLFEPETRAFYDLEMLWGDCEQVTWARPSQQ